MARLGATGTESQRSARAALRATGKSTGGCRVRRRRSACATAFEELGRAMGPSPGGSCQPTGVRTGDATKCPHFPPAYISRRVPQLRLAKRTICDTVLLENQMSIARDSITTSVPTITVGTTSKRSDRTDTSSMITLKPYRHKLYVIGKVWQA